MVHIILILLKILGIILLVLLGIMLLLVLAVLFVPIRYKIKISSESDESNSEEIFGMAMRKMNVKCHVNFSYMGPLARFITEYNNGDANYIFKICGITVNKKTRENDAEAQNEEKTLSGEKNRDAVIINENASDLYKEDNLQMQEVSENTESFDTEAESYDDLEQPPKGLFLKMKQKIANIKNIFKSASKSFKKLKKFILKVKNILEDEQFKDSFGFIKDKIIFFIKKIKPCIKKAEFTGSFGAPENTGKVIGFISIIRAWLNCGIIVIPDFECESIYIEGKAYLKGKIRLCHVAKLIYYYYFNKEVKYFMKQIRTNVLSESF